MIFNCYHYSDKEGPNNLQREHANELKVLEKTLKKEI